MVVQERVHVHVDSAERETGGWFAGFPALEPQLSLPVTILDSAEPIAPAQLSGCRVLVTTLRADTAIADSIGVPWLFVADGWAGGADESRVVHSGTNFRRDLPLSRLLEALECLDSGMLRPEAAGEEPPGRIAHVGHHGQKVSPDAIGFDAFRFDEHDWIADPRDLSCCADESFDSVVVNLRADDLWPDLLLDEALRITRIGGEVQVRIDAQSSGWAVLHKRVHDPVERPRPEVSVLIVGEVQAPETLESPRLLASMRAAMASLGDVDHEIRVLLRHRPTADALAELREFAAAHPACFLQEDFAPDSFPQRLTRLRRDARGAQVLVLASGALPCGAALSNMRNQAAARPGMVLPTFVDPLGASLDAEQAAGACLLVRAADWPPTLLVDSPYSTPTLLIEWADAVGASVAEDATVLTDGWAGRPLAGSAHGSLGFDNALRARGVPVAGLGRPEHLLLVALRTMGDCVLTTACLDDLAARAASLTVLTEARYAWLFRRHPSVGQVLVCSANDSDSEDLFWFEQGLIEHVLSERGFDRLVLMSDRLDSVPYFRSGLPFAEFYARQANLPSAAPASFDVVLSPSDFTAAGEILCDRAVNADYVVVHTRAGWTERTPPADLFRELCGAIVANEGLSVVIVGGADEAHDIGGAGIVNLAGHVSVEVSAAIIAGARLFVGPDSGSMHIASAFDVPTLGLFAGTSLRLVPPQATRAVAVQAVSTCSRPCGVSPCRERNCDASGFDAPFLATQIAALLNGRSVLREWFGTTPAIVFRSPEGERVVQGGCSRSVQALSPPSVRRRPARTNSRSCPVVDLSWRQDPLMLAMQQRRLLALRQAAGTSLSSFVDVAADLPPGSAHARAIGCLMRVRQPEALQLLLVAMAEVDAMSDRDERIGRRALTRTLACYSWPDSMSELFARWSGGESTQPITISQS